MVDDRFDLVLARVRDQVARRLRAERHLEVHPEAITLEQDVDYFMQAVDGATEEEVLREIALYDASQNALVPLGESVNGALDAVGANNRLARVGQICKTKRGYFVYHAPVMKKPLRVLGFLSGAQRLLDLIDKYDPIEEVVGTIDFGTKNQPQEVELCDVDDYILDHNLDDTTKYHGRILFDTCGLSGEIKLVCHETGRDFLMEASMFFGGGGLAVASGWLGCSYPLFWLGLIPTLPTALYGGFNKNLSSSMGLGLELSPRLQTYSPEDVERYAAMDKALKRFKL